MRLKEGIMGQLNHTQYYGGEVSPSLQYLSLGISAFKSIKRKKLKYRIFPKSLSGDNNHRFSVVKQTIQRNSILDNCTITQ